MERKANTYAAILRWLLLAGGVYFLAIAVAHLLRLQVPLLFVYYDVPSYGYQDRIISFLSFGWAVFLFAAAANPAKNRDAVRAILVAGLVAIFGLNVINETTDFRALAPGTHPAVFRRETIGLSVYVAALIFFYFLARGEKPDR